MNLENQVKQRRDKVLAFLAENPNNDLFETEIKVTIDEADVHEMHELAKKKGMDCLRFEPTLKRWFFCHTEMNKGLFTICVWSKHSTGNELELKPTISVYENDKTFENEKQYV